MHVDTEMCGRLAHEGIGSLYERAVLREFLTDLVKRHAIGSVLEYDCRVTKGYDNIDLMPHAEAAIAVASPEDAEGTWPFADRPRILPLNGNGTYDLVWSFAVAQVEPQSIERMKQSSREWVLLFVPNLFNWGGPFHRLLHLLTRTPCTHAEHRESLGLGTVPGVRRLLRSNGVTVCESGYIDKPWLPDIGFSKRELRELLGRSSPDGDEPVPPGELAATVEGLFHFERWRLPGLLQAVVAHHLYVLGRVTD